MRDRATAAGISCCCLRAPRQWPLVRGRACRRGAHRPPDRAAKDLPTIAQRIDFISAALRGTRYRGYTLIGGPHRPEQFVLRDDAFDCVTYCETVLAAALARNLEQFETSLREIRYRHGIVNWFERNHYFFEWGQRNVANKTCRWVAMDGEVELTRRSIGTRAGPAAVYHDRYSARRFLANVAMLATGDIVGFITRRPNLDYFHVGFIAFARAANCCCGMPRKAAIVCSTNAWTAFFA